jgi:hypothetical protein
MDVSMRQQSNKELQAWAHENHKFYLGYVKNLFRVEVQSMSLITKYGEGNYLKKHIEIFMKMMKVFSKEHKEKEFPTRLGMTTFQRYKLYKYDKPLTFSRLRGTRQLCGKPSKIMVPS